MPVEPLFLSAGTVAAAGVEDFKVAVVPVEPLFLSAGTFLPLFDNTLSPGVLEPSAGVFGDGAEADVGFVGETDGTPPPAVV